jgi:hypothetical protein
MISLRGSARNLDSQNVTSSKHKHGWEQASETKPHKTGPHTHARPQITCTSHGSNVTLPLSDTEFPIQEIRPLSPRKLTTANQEPSTIIIIPRSCQAQANELIKCSLDYSGSCSDSPAPTPLLATSEGWRLLSHNAQGQFSRVDGRYHVCCSRMFISSRPWEQR